MTIRNTDLAFVKYLFGGLDPLNLRKMMGGATFYCDGKVFAILSSQGQI